MLYLVILSLTQRPFHRSLECFGAHHVPQWFQGSLIIVSTLKRIQYNGKEVNFVLEKYKQGQRAFT